MHIVHCPETPSKMAGFILVKKKKPPAVTIGEIYWTMNGQKVLPQCYIDYLRVDKPWTLCPIKGGGPLPIHRIRDSRPAIWVRRTRWGDDVTVSRTDGQRRSLDREETGPLQTISGFVIACSQVKVFFFTLTLVVLDLSYVFSRCCILSTT